MASEANRQNARTGHAILLTAVFAVIAYLVIRNIGFWGNMVLVLLGFGAVVLVHEFGHFVVAKLAGIKVEAFSIFMPPMLLGVRRTGQGIKLRVLPCLFAGGGEKSGDSQAGLTIGNGGKESDTEYRVGLIPFGGFVKMLGQDDVGPVKAIRDPRSFANKPVGARMAVIAAGVTFNAISAAIIFMTVFLVGINLPPAIVGDVIPDSPAAKAGLKAGDEIIEIDGKSKDLDFSSVALAAALSDANELVPLRVRREDGTEKSFALTADDLPGGIVREFGILEPMSLTVAKVSDANELLRKTGLLPGDRVTSVNGRKVRTYWELAGVVRGTVLPQVKIGAERAGPSGTEVVESPMKLEIPPAPKVDVKAEADLYHIYSMVPRLQVTAVVADSSAGQDGRSSFLRRLAKKLGVGSGPTRMSRRTVQQKLQTGDIILAVGDIENPTFKELRDITRDYEGKTLPMRVLRAEPNGAEKPVTVAVEPRRSAGTDRVVIGIEIALDCAHAVVAKTIDARGGPARLEISRGAQITAIDGKAVSSFYDCINELRSARQLVTISFKTEQNKTGGVVVDAGGDEQFINVRSALSEVLPFEPMERLYRASGPVEALEMGYRRTLMFIGQTYVTLRQLIGGLISPKHLMGPVGIITLSYRIVSEQPLVYYAYFLALISATIAVFNFLPLPPFDGGLIVLMLIEKVKGSAFSEKTQGIMAYTGWVLVGTLLLYVTFNDIVRSFFS